MLFIKCKKENDKNILDRLEALIIGVRSKTHIVLACFKSAPHEKLSIFSNVSKNFIYVFLIFIQWIKKNIINRNNHHNDILDENKDNRIKRCLNKILPKMFLDYYRWR